MANLSFDIATAQFMDGRELKGIRPNAKGIYCGIPGMVLGTSSRNGVDYDPDSVAQSLSAPGTRFFINVTEGNQEGEFGHPLVKDQNDMARVIYIDRTKVSHRITRARTKQVDGFTVIYLDILPFGPYKNCLIESLESSQMNCSFSIRAICSSPENTGNGTQRKKVLFMITLDSVDGPGFKVASKRYYDATANVSVEAFSAPVTTEKLAETQGVAELIGMEALRSQQILDLFGANRVQVLHRSYQLNNGALRNGTLDRSVFHTLFK